MTAIPVGAVDRSTRAGLPNSLLWAYQASLNHQADLLFWQETNYKPNQRLDPNDPHDRAMIPAWYAARDRIARTRTPRELIRLRAIETVINTHAEDPNPVFVHAAGAGGSQTRSFPSLADPRTEEFVRDRRRHSAYIAIFTVNDASWPQPLSEMYPTPESDQSSSNVSGDAIIHHEGLVLRPLTADALARMPDLDPGRHDQVAASIPGWVDFEGNRQPPRLISRVYRPGDVFYYWNGPWGMLAGSRGIAVVRGGIVVATFQTVVS